MNKTSFRVVRWLSSGRFGKVYLINILDENDNATETYKVLKQSILETPLVPYEVVRECTVANEVRNNPRICAAEQIFLGDNYMFLLMNYLDGTLSDIVDQLREIRDPNQIDRAEQQSQYALKEMIEEENSMSYDDDDTASSSEIVSDEASVEDESLSQIDPILFESGTKVVFSHQPFDFTKSCATILEKFEFEPCSDHGLTNEMIEKLENDRIQELQTSLYEKYNVITRASRKAAIKQINVTGYKKFFFEMTKQLLQVMNEFEQYGLMQDDFRRENIGYQLLEDRSIQLVMIDFSHAKRLSNHYDASNQVPDFPSAPPELFAREPIVPQAFDTRAVGNCSGTILDPIDLFFSVYTEPETLSDDENEDEAEEEEEDDTQNDFGDNIINNNNDEKQECITSDEMHSWAGLEENQLQWFEETTEKYGLLMRINKQTGKNFDDERAEVQELDDNEVDEDKEAAELEKLMARRGENADLKELLDNYNPDNYLVIDVDDSNLHEFASHILNRRQYASLFKTDYWILYWWLQMFIRNPSKRPTVQTLLQQLENPETMKVVAPKLPRKAKLKTTSKKRKTVNADAGAASEQLVVLPNEVPTENWDLSLYTQQVPCNWQNNKDPASNFEIRLNNMQATAIKIALDQLNLTVHNEYENFPFAPNVPNNLQFLLMCSELYSELMKQSNETLYNTEEECVEAFKHCFLLAERWFSFYNRQLTDVSSPEVQMQFQRKMYSTLLRLNGRIDRPSSWYNQIASLVHQKYQILKDQNQIPNIINPEVKTYYNLYERPFSFYEICYNIALLLCWQASITTSSNQQPSQQFSLSLFVDDAFQLAHEMVSFEGEIPEDFEINKIQRQLVFANFPATHSLTAATI